MPPPRNLSPSILHTDCQRAVKSELSLRGALHFGIIPKWQPSAYHSIQDDTSATNKQTKKKKECTHANIRGVDQNSLSNNGCLTCSKHQPSSHHTFHHWIQTVQVQRRNTNRKVSLLHTPQGQVRNQNLVKMKFIILEDCLWCSMYSVLKLHEMLL